MIVQEPPYELVALFSDLEMQKLLEGLIERGQQDRRRCARAFRWRSLRDPRRDTVWSQPERVLLPFLRMDCRFLIVWDHHGTGLEGFRAADVEERVVRKMEAVGAPTDRVLAVALEPELEKLLVPVWPKVKELMSQERAAAPPDDSAILAELRKLFPARGYGDRKLEDLLNLQPKEVFESLVRLLRLRRAPPLYQKLGAQVSLPSIKREQAATRIASSIADWFPYLTHPESPSSS